MTALAVFRPTCAVCFKLYWLKCVLLLCTYSANMTWRDALDQVKKLRLAARSQLLNCNVHADRGNVCYYGSWCCSLSFFCCGCHQTSFRVVNSVVVARRNSGLLPILRTLVFFYIDVNFEVREVEVPFVVASLSPQRWQDWMACATLTIKTISLGAGQVLRRLPRGFLAFNCSI